MQQGQVSNGNKVAFLDTNILSNIIKFNHTDFSQIINQIYDTVYVHKFVLDEFRTNKKDVETFIKKYPNWHVFDENDEKLLSDEEYELYNIYYNEIKEKLKEIDKLRNIVGHANEGEAHSIAATYIIQAEYICSHDLSIKDTMVELDLSIEKDEDLQLILQHDLYDLCELALQIGTKRSTCKKFVSVFHEDFHDSNKKLAMKKFVSGNPNDKGAKSVASSI